MVRNRRTPKCSTWNNLIKFAVCISFSASIFLFSFPKVDAVSVGATPISGGNVGGLLSSMGYLDKRLDGLYDWALHHNDDSYTQDIFGNWVPKIKTGEPLSDDDLAPLLGTVIPEDTYTYDSSGNYYVGSKQITTADLYIKASALSGFAYGMPVNLSGSAYPLVNWVDSNSQSKSAIFRAPLSSVGSGSYFFPYYVTSTGSFVCSVSINFTASNRTTTYDFVKDGFNYSSSGLFTTADSFILAPAHRGSYMYLRSANSNGDYTSVLCQAPTSVGGFVRVDGSGDYSFSESNSATLLETTGLPSLFLQGDKTKLEDAVVKVGDDDDNQTGGGGSTPPVPQSPNGWEIWHTVTDLLRQIDTGEITNGGTDYQQYVNNDYNYVDVDINVPDTIHNDVIISGGLDITGSGDVDITIHEDVSLPSAGDGTSFYNPDATDVIGALGKDNPVTAVISGLFSALDPALVGIFSISVSLLFVLGLWKLIRG